MADRLPPRSIALAAAVAALLAAGIHLAAGTAAAEADDAEAGEAAAGALAGDVVKPPLAELNEALTAAKDKLEQLETAAEMAAEAAGLREDVRALEQENERLAAGLAQTETALDAARTSAEEAADELRINQAAMAEAAERTSAELAQVREQLDATRDQLADAESAQERDRQRVVALRASLEQTQTEAATARDDLTRAQEELSAVRAARAQAEQERDAARQDVKQLQTTVSALDKDLTRAEARADELRAAKADTEEELALLREAARLATGTARDNLKAMEAKIQRLHSALQGAGAAELPLETGPAAGQNESSDAAPVRGKDAAPAGGPADGSTSATAREAESDGAHLAPWLEPDEAEPAAFAAVQDDLAGIKAAEAAVGDGRPTPIAAYTAELPLEARLQVQSLLADLDATTNSRGVLLTVPSEKLFAVGSEEIGANAHTTLAKVAEVIGIYEDREVVITGHTDALGEPVYDRVLSERRADLVRTFFVENFGIDAARLKTQGLDEQRPEASAAVATKPQPSRRLEVLILN